MIAVTVLLALLVTFLGLYSWMLWQWSKAFAQDAMELSTETLRQRDEQAKTGLDPTSRGNDA